MRRWLIILLLIGVIAGCSSAPAADSAVAAVQRYLETRIAADTQGLIILSCAAWESNATIEADSFRARNAKIEDLQCTENGADGAFTLVRCTGKILANYAGETREVDLATRQFKTIQEGGQWKMCGYK
jgi:hypothetical protein